MFLRRRTGSQHTGYRCVSCFCHQKYLAPCNRCEGPLPLAGSPAWGWESWAHMACGHGGPRSPSFQRWGMLEILLQLLHLYIFQRLYSNLASWNWRSHYSASPLNEGIGKMALQFYLVPMSVILTWQRRIKFTEKGTGCFFLEQHIPRNKSRWRRLLWNGLSYLIILFFLRMIVIATRLR